MALLTFGVNQTYEYFHCGPEAATASLLAIPTTVLTTSNTHSLSPQSTIATISPARLTSSVPSPTSSPLAPPNPSTSSVPLSSISTNQALTLSSMSSGQESRSGGGDGDGDSNGGNNVGPIIGGIIGGLALLCVFGGVVVYLIVKAKLDKTARLQDNSDSGAQGAQGAYVDKIDRRQGGWGPSELPTGRYCARSPVELPTRSPSNPPMRPPFKVPIRSPVELPTSNRGW